MARRSFDESPVSFFSFQDIVTSISGIMIFIVLLLALDMTTAAFTPQQVSTPIRPEMPLEAEVAALEARLTELQARLETARTASSDMLSASPAEVRGAIQELEKKIQTMDTAKDFRDEARRHREKKVEALREALRKTARDIKELARAKERLDATMHKRVVFAFAEEEQGRKVLVLECSATELLLQEIQSEKTPVAFRDASPANRIASLEAALGSYPAASHQILVILKPSAFGFGFEFVEKLKALGYAVGYEPIEEDCSTLGPPR